MAAVAPAAERRYSCGSASETLEWMNAIADFLRPFKPLIDAHVVNFFKDKLWEIVDEQWIECLRKEPVEVLLKLPSGFVQNHWPDTLKDFVCTLKSLILPRQQGPLNQILPNLIVSPLGTVLTQGMNLKKKHEVEILAAVISSIANHDGFQTVVDVGSGQGYLAQALSFQYKLHVVAIDASLHHATVTNARAERIKKHYSAKSGGSGDLIMPQTVTCHVLSSQMLTHLSTASLDKDVEHSECKISSEFCLLVTPKQSSGTELIDSNGHYSSGSLLLAGLHACGDLSSNMLRTFVECKHVKALVCVGCCYNLLCEDKTSDSCGFPVSNAAKLSEIVLGKSARDLACQSADRWSILTGEAAFENFDLHTYRAAFQMVLEKYFPEVIKSSPSVGRQGKALRRKKFKRCLANQTLKEGAVDKEQSTVKFSKPCAKSDKTEVPDACCIEALATDGAGCYSGVLGHLNFSHAMQYTAVPSDKADKFRLFEEFTESGLGRLGHDLAEGIDLREIWEGVQQYTELIGPFWSLRVALGPLVETYILLDRLLFLQEQGKSIEAFMLPLFDPTLSPRNVALVARRK